MPSQKKQQYEDALGSIFDFIYSESQKPADKVKPVKVTGVDGTSEVVDAIGAVLENPLLFVTNNTMESFLEAVDIDMAKFSLTDRGRGMSFNLKDIGKIVSDPNKALNSLASNMAWTESSESFQKFLSIDPINKGFKAEALRMSPEALSQVQQYLAGRFAKKRERKSKK